MADTKAENEPKKPSGLAGVVAGKSSVGFIDGQVGTLRYFGYDIHDLAEHSCFEETVHLLWNGDLPSRTDLADFTTSLAAQRPVDPAILDFIAAAPPDVTPMGLLRTAVSALGQYDPDAEDMSAAANKRKAGRLTAQLATLVAAIHRGRLGLEAVAPDPALGHAANFLYMLSGERADATATRALDVALVLHADHGFNASTFSAKVTAATLSDMHSAVTSAVGTLKGPLHGGANQRVRESLDEIGTVERVEEWVDAKLAAKQKIMGFGHRVYKVEDPRARHLRDHARALQGNQDSGGADLVGISQRLVEVVAERKGLAVNVDFWSASLYSYLGVAPDLFPMIFALSRISGWTTHVMEQYADNKLIRPRAEYIGPDARAYVPVADRS
ncbi:MAG TPA: citrate/2-methylcitrate synthase [Acidobacteriota bacterium]|nr:citrate/2-methylcitrate synthase [Acidobacteriota bacterium]